MCRQAILGFKWGQVLNGDSHEWRFLKLKIATFAIFEVFVMNLPKSLISNELSSTSDQNGYCFLLRWKRHS